MTCDLAHKTLGELVSAHPELARVFERLNIDYCCGGKLPLEEACAQRGLDLHGVARELEQAAKEPDNTLVDASVLGLAELADHIEQTHHAYLKRELPRIEALTEKVAAAHGQHDPRLMALRKRFLEFQAELVSHMLKEERILFPAIRLLARSSQWVPVPFGSLANPIQVMESEHDQAATALAWFREWTDGYTPPAGACDMLQALYRALAELEADMHQHVH